MLLTGVAETIGAGDAKGDAAADALVCLVRGSAVGQDGRSSALTAPNGPAQQAVILSALETAAVRPADVASLQARVRVCLNHDSFTASMPR